MFSLSGAWRSYERPLGKEKRTDHKISQKNPVVKSEKLKCSSSKLPVLRQHSKVFDHINTWQQQKKQLFITLHFSFCQNVFFPQGILWVPFMTSAIITLSVPLIRE